MIDLSQIIWPANLPFDIKEHSLFICNRGSESHGLYVPSSDPDSFCDRDIYAVVIPPIRFYLGQESFEHAEQINGEWDVVVDEFKKFIFLLKKQNPTAMSMLWLRRGSDYIHTKLAAEDLFGNRDAFRARDLAHKSFVGHALNQFKKMTENACRGYMGAKRKKLVERHGYDAKNAGHLIRLLKMCAEFHRTGELHVYRYDDREELLSIKQGALSLQEVRTYAEALFKDAEKAYGESILPEKLDEDRIEWIVQKMMCGWFGVDAGREW